MSPALKFLCAAVFILVAVPRLNISIGPIPLYLIDVCLFATVFFGGLRRPAWEGTVPRGRLILLILGLVLLSELVGAIAYGTVVESIYMSARMCLAVSLFFSLNNIIQTDEDLTLLLKAATAGMLVTASLMVMTSLPGTRGMVSGLFGIDMLTPAGDRFFDTYATTGRGVRGQSLVGYNIISAWFVCLIWPLAIALYRSEQTRGIWRRIAMAAVILGPFGILFSYSRGAILGLVLVVAALLIFGEGRLKAQVAVALTVVVLVIGFVGLDSEVFYFERIERRTRATIENPLENEMESERFLSYVHPFKVAMDHPLIFITADGLTKDRAIKRGYLNPRTAGLFRVRYNVADHSLFAKATITYGMLAAFSFLALFGFALRSSYVEARLARLGEDLNRLFPQLAFASTFGMSAWVAFDKGIVLQPRGAMMFFLVLALAGVSQSLRLNREQAEWEQWEAEEEEKLKAESGNLEREREGESGELAVDSHQSALESSNPELVEGGPSIPDSKFVPRGVHLSKPRRSTNRR